MDQAFDWAQQADWDQNEDLKLNGITTALGVTEDAPPSLAVVVAGPGTAYGKDGERIRMSDTVVNKDMSLDEYGSATTVLGALNERWVSLFIRFKRNATDPAVDGNSVTVYTKQQESYELFVRQASEQVAGTNTKPAVMTDAILLCDIQLIFGQTTITNAGISLIRREDYTRKTGTTISDLVAGDPKTAIEWLYSALDTFSVPAALPFSFAATWFGSVAVGTGVTDVDAALEAIVADLAASTGSAKVGAADVSTTYVSWSGVSVQGALSEIATATSAHIAGGAPAHAATAITYSDTAYFASAVGAAAANVQVAIDELVYRLIATATGADGAAMIGLFGISGAKASVATSDIQAALADIYGELNTAVAWMGLDESISGDWSFSGVPKLASASMGGGDGLHTGNRLAMGNWSKTNDRQGPGQPFGIGSDTSVGGTLADICSVVDPDNSGNFLAVVIEDDGSNFYYCDPEEKSWTTQAITGLTAGVTEVTSMCSDGEDLYILVRRAAGIDTVAKISFTNGTIGTKAWEVALTNANGLIGYPMDRIIAGDPITNSPWVIDLIILCGNVSIGTSGVVQKNQSDTGAAVWNATSNAALAAHKAGGGLTHDGDTVYYTIESTGTDAQKLGRCNYVSGVSQGEKDMGASYQASDVARDLVFDGRKVVWVNRAGNVRYYQPGDTGYAQEVLYNSTTTALNYFGFCLGFDGSNIWIPSVDYTGTIQRIDLAKIRAADFTFNNVVEYNDVIYETATTWAPVLTPWDMGRMSQVGSFMAVVLGRPGAPANRNAVTFIRNSSLW